MVTTAAAAGSTFQTGDTINGTPNGNNKVVITDAGNFGGAIVGTVNNVAEIKHNLLASNVYNEALYNGVVQEYATNGIAGAVLEVQNAQLATTFGIKDSTNGGDLTVGIRATDLTGTANTLNLSVRNAGLLQARPGLAPTNVQSTILANSNGIEAIALATTGANNIILQDNPAAGTPTDYAKLTVTGDGANAIDVSALGQTVTYDLSGSTGANTLNFGAALVSNTSITGGTGVDTIRVNQGSVQAGISLSGVEILRSSVGGSTGTIAFTTSSLNTIRVDGDAGEGGRLTLVAPGSVATINYIGDGLAAGAAAVEQFKALTITGAYAGAADAVTVNISNAGTTNLAGYTLNFGGAGAAIDADGIETLVVNATNIAAAGTTTFTGGIASNSLQSISFVSAGAVNSGVIDAAPVLAESALTMVDLSGVTATANSTISFDGAESIGAATQVRGPQGTGALTINTGVQGPTDTLIVTGGQGNTTVNAFTAAAAGTAFDGTLVFTSTTAGVTNTLNVGDQDATAVTDSTTVATFSGAGSVNSVVGGVGIDTITVTANGLGSTNTIRAGLGADVINIAASTVSVTTQLTSYAAVDAVTGFSVAKDVAALDLTPLNAALVAAGGAGDSVLVGAGTSATAATAIDFSAILSAGATFAATDNIFLIDGATAAAVDAILVDCAFSAAGANLSQGAGIIVAYVDTSADLHIAMATLDTLTGTAIDAVTVADMAVLTGTYTLAGLSTANFDFIAS